MKNSIYRRSEYSNFFKKKYLRLLRAALNPNEQRPNYKDRKIIDELIAPFEELAKAPNIEQHANFPRKIWILWQQGWDKAPPIVRACAKSWQEKNKNWQIYLLDENKIADYAPIYSEIYAPKASRTARANIARLSLLHQQGGVWADATLFCQQPLDDWINKVMGAGFFMFKEPRPYRYSEIWFMASFKQTYLTEKWLELVIDYWQHFKHPHHYYWMEYLFEFLAQQDEEIARIWNLVPKLPANSAHIIQSTPFETDASRFNISTKEQEIFPVHKLSHKWQYRGSLKNTPIGMLTGLENLRSGKI